MKLWGGRFEKALDAAADGFNSSISFDFRLIEEDIAGSIAHAAMLGESGIVAPDEAELIIAGLTGILRDVLDGKAEPAPGDEDVHMFVERLLTQRIGQAGKKLHTARSRNDQVALDMRLYVKKTARELISMLGGAIDTVAAVGMKHLDAVMPGYTHMQRAQPVTFGHYMAAWGEMLKRDCGRLSDCVARMDFSPLGSGALAGTTHPIDREAVADRLGFAGITPNSLDGVSDRDFCIEFLSCLSVIMMHLSRCCEEFILWCSWEFRFLEPDEAWCTGSSIMPQKKNPDPAELIRGKTGRVYGSLFALLTVMKGLPLAYNKDMQEDKQAVFDAADTVKACLSVFSPMLQTAVVRRDNMRAAAAKGFINATDCADWLVGRGIPFRDAYTVVGKLVALCEKEGKTLEQLPLKDYRALCPAFDEGIYEAIDLDNCVQRRNIPGGPAPEAVERHLNALSAFAKEIK